MFTKFEKRNKVRNAVLASLYAGLITLFITLYTLIYKPNGTLNKFNDPWMFFD